MKTRRLDLRALLLAAAFVLPAGSAVAQQAVAAGQVPGSQLQQWVDSKFTYAGIHYGSGCFFMNTADAAGRVLFLSCPNGSTATYKGSIRVVGDAICTTFSVPNTSAEECLTWHATGERRFEQRKDSLVSTSLTVLSVVPMGNR